MKTHFFKTSLVIVFVFCLNIVAQAEQDKMAWWRDARFGLFVHWGLYAIPAGEWKGEKISGISEWIMLRAKIPVAEYEALAKQFNPVKYDADEWVRLAKEAGMKYIVITSKHHDGFAMFHSKTNPYNIVDATPFDRDPLKELKAACKKHGLKLGFYHSQAQDWHHPGGSYRGYEQGEPHWDPTMKRVPFEQYIEEKVIPQVTELLTNYGKLDIFWWDTPIGMTEPLAERLIKLLDMQPGIVANNRLYRPWPGDFSTPEQHIPPTGLDYDWETCMTMNTSWGYKHYDDNWKSTETLIRNLTDAASKGGNYLLNVGPTAEGEIPQPSIERLEGIGKWMKVNSESIYETTASPFFKLLWGRCTQKTMNGGTKLYLHVFDWPKNNELVVPGLKNKVKKAYLLANNQNLNVSSNSNGVVVDIPNNAPDPINTVVVLDVPGELNVMSNKPTQATDGSIELPVALGFIHNRGYGIHAELSALNKDAFVTNWKDSNSRVEWMLMVKNPGKFKIQAELACADRSELSIGTDDSKTEATVNSTGGMNAFKQVDLGTIDIEKRGDIVLEARPKKGNWNPIHLRSLTLVPID
jgi:alpha-L-fucosidase